MAAIQGNVTMVKKLIREVRKQAYACACMLLVHVYDLRVIFTCRYPFDLMIIKVEYS